MTKPEVWRAFTLLRPAALIEPGLRLVIRESVGKRPDEFAGAKAGNHFSDGCTADVQAGGDAAVRQMTVERKA